MSRDLTARRHNILNLREGPKDESENIKGRVRENKNKDLTTRGRGEELPFLTPVEYTIYDAPIRKILYRRNLFHQEELSIVINYLRQVAVSESVRETIKRALNRSDEMEVRMKAGRIPTTDSILRAVSLASHIDSEESLKEFISDHILDNLRLTPAQKEHFKQNS